MLAIHDSLKALACERPVFHSEADFQHALAWRLQREHSSAQLRLEVPFGAGKRRYFDILFQNGGERIVLELKYKTRGLHLSMRGEGYHLRDQGAQPIGRYDFLKDIERLETLTNHSEASRGFVILLSNDHGYWTAPRSHTVDAAFRLHERSLLRGTRHWDPNTSAGTMRGREEPLQLRGKYRNHWCEYAQVAEGAGGTFRYLLHEIRAS